MSHEIFELRLITVNHITHYNKLNMEMLFDKDYKYIVYTYRYYFTYYNILCVYKIVVLCHFEIYHNISQYIIL